ncbi:MAG: hypothetical protein WKG52_00935 [Variovorax sp.]
MQRFSRTLDERRPYERSSCAQIVPMESQTPLHPADRIVLIGSACAGLALVVLLSLEHLA